MDAGGICGPQPGFSHLLLLPAQPAPPLPELSPLSPPLTPCCGADSKGEMPTGPAVQPLLGSHYNTCPQAEPWLLDEPFLYISLGIYEDERKKPRLSLRNPRGKTSASLGSKHGGLLCPDTVSRLG